MNHDPSQSSSIPLNQKIAFGIGMLANQMFPAALQIFLIILVQGLGMDPLLWGIIFFVPRMIDAITDPLMGYVTDNFESRWGKRRPFIFAGALITGVSFIFMWQLYAENSQMYNFIYHLAWSFGFVLGLTIFSVPYLAMGYEMSSDFHERTRLMAIAQWIGQWAWIISPWFWVYIFDQSLFESSAEGARTLSIWVGIICTLLALVPAFFCRENRTRDKRRKESSNVKNLKESLTKFFQGIIETLKFKPFQKICLATFLIFNSYNTVAAFSFFIIVHYMHGGDLTLAGNWPALFGSVSSLFTCFLVIPSTTWISHKIGKKKTFLISQSISIFGYILFWWAFSPSNPALMFVAAPFFVFGIGGLFTIMMSMTADICDLDEFKNGTRREGTFSAIYWWMVKFGFAIAGLLTGIILKIVGFDQNATIQTEEALTGLRLAYIIIPIIGTLLAIWFMRNYDLDEDKATEIRIALDQRKGSS